MPDLFTAIARRAPLVVGAAGGRKALEATVSSAVCDVIELRLDALGSGESVQHFAAAHKARLPLLITARHPDEGGHGGLSAEDRAAAYRALMPHAALIDLELRSLGDLAPVWNEAATRGLLRVASWHCFESCPGLDDLLARIAEMHAAGADVAKCAFRIAEPAGLQTLAEVLCRDSPLPLAVMGMGPLAPASRVLAAQLGSVLNYGYLGSEPTAPGQWPARLLKEAIASSGKQVP